MAGLADVLKQGGFSIGAGGVPSAPSLTAPVSLQEKMATPATITTPGGIQLSPKVAGAADQTNTILNRQGGLVSLPKEPAPPVLGPATPPAFKADVPNTMDASQMASSLSDPAHLPAIKDPGVYQMNDGRFYNPSTGISNTDRNVALGIAQDSGTSDFKDAGLKQDQTSTPTIDTSTHQDDVTQAIQSLFPQPDTLVKQYQDLRASSGLVADETALASANKEAADMQAVINGIEDEVRNQAGGQADESFIQATIADRMRRLMPQINRINARVTALSENVKNKKDTITQQIGLSQQDVTNARQQQQDLRQGLNDMLTTFGSSAFSGMDKATIASLEQRAGLPTGSLSAKAKTLEETKLAQKSYDFQVAGDKLIRLDKTTGETVDTGISVPQNKKTAVEEAIAIAGALKDVSDPAQVLSFIQSYSGHSDVATTKKVGELTDEELGNVLVSMAKKEGFGSDPSNRPTRNNNPLNIKLGSATKHWVDSGLATVDKSAATDGGNFLVFKDAATGLQAAEELIRSGVYSNLDLNSALKKWSGGGYGAEIVSGVKSLGDAFKKPDAVPPISAQAPDDISRLANRVVTNPKLDDKDRAAFAKNFNALIDKGDKLGAIAAVKDTALKALPAGQQNDYTEFKKLDTRLGGVIGNLNAFKSVNPNLYNSIYQKGKTLAGASKDKDWLRFTSLIESLQVTLRKELFGTAITDRESATGQNLFIDTSKDTLSDIEVKLKNLRDLATQSQEGILNYALGTL